MPKIAYHCSLEQFSPKELLAHARLAEQAGFQHLSCSDHFAPWSQSQGHSSNAWCWMGAVLASTNMSCGTVCSPAYRYHPAVIAQMAATLGQMYPSRIWLALGSGEYLNEQLTGEPWPSKEIRNTILKESTEIIRLLLEGQRVSYKGYVKIETAQLYTLPEGSIPLIGAALSPETTAYVGTFTDGLITVGPFEKVKTICHGYRQQFGQQKKLMIKLDLSYAHSKKRAIESGWEQWKYTQIGAQQLAELRYPEQFEEAAQKMTQEEFAEKILIATSPKELRQVIEQFAQLGCDQINLHNVNKDQQTFIQDISIIIQELL